MLIGTITNTQQIDTLTIGDSLSFVVRDPSYPASLWTLQFVLSLQGSKVASKDATASVDDHSVDITSEDSSKYKAGRCQAWFVYTKISDPTMRRTVTAGWLTVTPNPLGNLAPSETKLALDAVNRAIKEMASNPQVSVSFNNQSYSYHNPRDIYEIRDRLLRTYDAECAEMGIPTRSGHKTIRSRFVG